MFDCDSLKTIHCCIRKITERLFRLWVILIVEDPTVTVKCRTAIKVMFIYFNLCVSVMLNSLSYLFTSILQNVYNFLLNVKKCNQIPSIIYGLL